MNKSISFLPAAAAGVIQRAASGGGKKEYDIKPLFDKRPVFKKKLRDYISKSGWMQAGMELG